MMNMKKIFKNKPKMIIRRQMNNRRLTLKLKLTGERKNLRLRRGKDIRNETQAINCKGSNQWKGTMNEELRSLEENNTWALTDTPSDKSIIEVKWIYRIKSNGKYKARVVAKGFQQSRERKNIFSGSKHEYIKSTIVSRML